MTAMLKSPTDLDNAYMACTEPLWEPPKAEPPDAQAPGVGHNSGARPAAKAPESATVFEQFEAIVDSPIFTAEQKCILVKVRCRVDGKTKGNAIASNEGLMRAASLKDPRALRAELRDLQGKTRDLPEERDKRGRPIYDPIDDSRATIVLEERPGKASIIGFRPERLHAIVVAYLQHREQKRGPGKPPASHSGGLTRKPPAPDTGGLAKPPASHAENPLRQTHPDPFPLSGRKKEGAEPPAPPSTTRSSPYTSAASSPPTVHQNGSSSANGGNPSRHGRRLPSDWVLPAEWKDWALAEFSVTPTQVEREAAKFADHWHGVPPAQQRGRRSDWAGTWRNWCRREKTFTPRARPVSPLGDHATLLPPDRCRELLKLYPVRHIGDWRRDVHGPLPNEPSCRFPLDIIRELRLSDTGTSA